MSLKLVKFCVAFRAKTNPEEGKKKDARDGFSGARPGRWSAYLLPLIPLALPLLLWLSEPPTPFGPEEKDSNTVSVVCLRFNIFFSSCSGRRSKSRAQSRGLPVWCRWSLIIKEYHKLWFPSWLSRKESICNAGDTGDAGLVPGSGRSPGGGHGNPLQYPCLENPMDRGAWRATVHRVAKS